MSALPFDVGDPAIQRWLSEVHVTVDDLVMVLCDMQRRKRKRDLGRRQQRRISREAHRKLLSLLGRPVPSSSSPGNTGSSASPH